MNCTVSRTELAAALLFASDDESRFVINGLLIETSGVSQPTIVACDGRRLAVIETVAEQPETPKQTDSSVILHPGVIRSLITMSKSLGGKLNPWIRFDAPLKGKQLQITLVGCDCFIDIEKGGVIEGEYPNWRATIPAKDSASTPITDLGLNAEFIGDFAKAAKLMESEQRLIQMNLIGAESAIEVRIFGLSNFYGLVMPATVEEEIDYQPEFLAISKTCPKNQKPQQSEITAP